MQTNFKSYHVEFAKSNASVTPFYKDLKIQRMIDFEIDGGFTLARLYADFFEEKDFFPTRFINKANFVCKYNSDSVLQKSAFVYCILFFMYNCKYFINCRKRSSGQSVTHVHMKTVNCYAKNLYVTLSNQVDFSKKSVKVQEYTIFTDSVVGTGGFAKVFDCVNENGDEFVLS